MLDYVSLINTIIMELVNFSKAKKTKKSFLIKQFQTIKILVIKMTKEYQKTLKKNICHIGKIDG